MYVGVALPDIVDVRALVVTVVVFTVAAITYLGLFMTVASLLELAAGETPTVGALAVVGALVATTFRPLQVVLRGVVDELLFGRRPDPLDAANAVAGRIGEDPLLALRAIREALVLPYAALRDGDRRGRGLGHPHDAHPDGRPARLDDGARRGAAARRPHACPGTTSTCSP